MRFYVLSNCLFAQIEAVALLNFRIGAKFLGLAYPRSWQSLRPSAWGWRDWFPRIQIEICPEETVLLRARLNRNVFTWRWRSLKRATCSLLLLGLFSTSASANSGHEGTEQALTHVIVAQILGGPGSRVGMTWRGGTPNHKALAAAVAYGWGLKTAADRPAARKLTIEFLNGQLRTFMAVGGVNEFETPSHYSWWQEAYAAIWWAASRAQDQEVLALIRRIEIQARTVEDAGITPSGHVVLPGGRCFDGAGEADQRVQRDQGLAIIEGRLAGRKMHLPAEILDAKAAPRSTDRTGLWILAQIPRAELDVVAKAPAEMPSVLDPIQIQRSATGGVAWFDSFQGLRPCWYATWGPKGESYGGDPNRPKGAPGGKRPADVVPPTAGPPVKVWHLGAGAAR